MVSRVPELPHLPSRYRIVELLGEGGMGRVFRVHDEVSSTDAALKTLRADGPDDERRFCREMRTLSQLRHENIVRLFDVGTAGGEVFFTMELVEGVTLDAFLDLPPPGRRELRWLLAVACKLLEGLDYLHAKGLVHRDIKPSNVMVVSLEDASPLRGPEDVVGMTDPAVKILDLGLARERLAAVNPKEFQSGTPLYMSPEQLTGSLSVDERSDLYSVGGLLYHFITRAPPYTRLADAIAHHRPPLPPIERNPECPPDLSQIVMRLLERERHARPASAAELRVELLSVLSERHRVEVDRPRLLPPSFVGRDDSVRKLRCWLGPSAEGRGHVIRVVGERGSGKTWLLQQGPLKGEAFAEHGMVHVTGRFREGEALQQGLRGVCTDLLRLLRANRTPQDIAEALGVAGRELATRLGLELDAPRNEASASNGEPFTEATQWEQITREQFLQAAVSLVRLAAEAQPLLVIFEDIHNASDIEREFIARCVRIAPGMSALLVLTYRPEARPDHEDFARWIQPLESTEVSTLVDLGPLTDGEVRELAESMLRPRAGLSRDLLSVLVDRSEGRPLKVARILQVLWDRQALTRTAAGWTFDETWTGGDEDDERAQWEERFRFLDDHDRIILAAAGILRAPFDVALLRAVLSSAGKQSRDRSGTGNAGGEHTIERRLVLPSLRSLVARGLLVETEDGFAAPADLHPERLEECVPTESRRRLHAGAADALLERQRDSGEHYLFRIARHCEIAGRSRRASEYYLAAARQAAGNYANQRAQDAYQRAVELAGDLAAESVVAEELGEFYTRIGKYPLALDAFRRAGGLAPKGVEVDTAKSFLGTGLPLRLLDKIGEVLRLQGEFGDALAVSSHCLEAGRDDPATRARALYRMGLLQLEQGDPGAARTHLEESLRLYEELDAPDRMSKVQWQLGLVEKLLGRLDEAARRYEEALESAQKSGQEIAVGTALNNLGNIHRARGKDHLARECLVRSIEVRERIADRAGLAVSLNSLAQVHQYRGEFASALERTEAALEIFEEIGDKKGVLIARCNLGEALRLGGRLDRARDVLARGMELAETLHMPVSLYPSLCNLGNLEIDAGNYATAARHLRDCLRRLPEGQFALYRALALGSLSMALLRQGDFEGAEGALEECLLTLEESEFTEKLGEVASYRVRLELTRGDIERALEIGRRSMKGIESGVERMGRAMLRRELGCAFREIGPEWADQTEKHLYFALEEFEDMGSPQNVAATEADLAVYWSHHGEVEEAGSLFERAERRFLEIGATGRLKELATLRSML